ncbi:MAG: hypothetical protein AAGG38_06680 [Planctomycetota bacterium]
MRSLCVAFFLTVGPALTGCQNVAPVPPVVSPVAVSAEAYPRTFKAGLTVLRDAGFQIDRQDYRFGRITTEPKGAPTLFEPWIPDNTNGQLAVRATLGDLRRTVTLVFEPLDVDAPSVYRLAVQVLIERQQVPTRRLNGATRGSVFADLREAPAEWADRGIGGRYWQPIERDPGLERKLLQAILHAASSPPAPNS